MLIIIAIYHVLVIYQSGLKYFIVKLLLISSDSDHLNSFNFKPLENLLLRGVTQLTL